MKELPEKLKVESVWKNTPCLTCNSQLCMCGQEEAIKINELLDYLAEHEVKEEKCKYCKTDYGHTFKEDCAHYNEKFHTPVKEESIEDLLEEYANIWFGTHKLREDSVNYHYIKNANQDRQKEILHTLKEMMKTNYFDGYEKGMRFIKENKDDLKLVKEAKRESIEDIKKLIVGDKGGGGSIETEILTKIEAYLKEL
jgi:hypothetical protein